MTGRNSKVGHRLWPFAGVVAVVNANCFLHVLDLGNVSGHPYRGATATMSPPALSHVEAILGGPTAAGLPSGQLSDEDKALYTVMFACRVFEIFLRVHPYANGNGHVARFLIWSILGRYDYWPQQWPIEPRPPDPPDSQLIVEYRNGNPEPLEQYVLQCIAG